MLASVTTNPTIQTYQIIIKKQLTSASYDYDATNLYGQAMVQKLPARNFSWSDMDDEMISEVLEAILERPEDYWASSDMGYTLEVDLEYPSHLHDKHNDFPLAPEKMTTSENQLSDYSRNLITTGEGKMKIPKCEKLVCHFNTREKYVVSVRTLAVYRRHGLIVSKIHRAVVYEQEDWMADWINGNTAKRTAATSDFAKDLFKLANTARFSKTMECVRGRSNTRLTTNPEQFAKLVKKPTFHSHTEIGSANENVNKLHAVEMVKSTVKLDKCIFAGSTVLDLSKSHMYTSHYDRLKPMFENDGGVVKLGDRYR